MDDLARKALALLTGQPPEPRPATAMDDYNSVFAVRINSPIIGEYWFVLSDTEPFDPGDDLPVYRPSEISALKGQGLRPAGKRSLRVLAGSGGSRQEAASS